MPATTTIIRVDNTTDQKVPLFECVYLVLHTPHISRPPFISDCLLLTIRAACVMFFNLASSLCLVKSADRDQTLLKQLFVVCCHCQPPKSKYPPQKLLIK
jgi:hypothetical protein